MIDDRSLEIIQFCKDYFSKNDKVLDIGSGTGWVAKHMQEVLGLDIICVDIVKEHQTDVPFTLYNGKQLPFKDNQFDVSLLIYTLHHCDNPLTVLKEAKRVSRNKIIIFEDTYTNFFDKVLARIFDYYVNKKYNPDVQTPFKFRKIEQWVSLFKDLHLRVACKKNLKSHWKYPVKHVAFVLEIGR